MVNLQKISIWIDDPDQQISSVTMTFNSDASLLMGLSFYADSGLELNEADNTALSTIFSTDTADLDTNNRLLNLNFKNGINITDNKVGALIDCLQKKKFIGQDAASKLKEIFHPHLYTYFTNSNNGNNDYPLSSVVSNFKQKKLLTEAVETTKTILLLEKRKNTVFNLFYVPNDVKQIILSECFPSVTNNFIATKQSPKI